MIFIQKYCIQMYIYIILTLQKRYDLIENRIPFINLSVII